MRRPRIWFDPPLLRWPRVLGVAALAVAAVAGGLAYERGLWREAAAPAPGVLASVPGLPTAASAPPARRVATVAPAPRIAVAASGPRRKPGPNEIEVCGLGIVAMKPDGSDDPLAVPMARSRSAPARVAWQAALLSSQDARLRAAGWRLEAVQRPDDPRPVSALAQLAHDSREPMVYALAMGACHARHDRPPPGACQLLSAEQWVTVDPDNGVPWLHLAAVPRFDPTGALHRAAGAKVMRSYWGAVHPLVMSAQPANTPPFERLAMSTDAMSIAVAMPAPPYPARYCDATAVRDANRRQQCDALAELFVSRGETLLDLATGRAIGERVGWPAERLNTLRDEREALPAVQRAQWDPADVFSCASIQHHAEYFAEVAARGELGALREALRRSGGNVTELAAQARREAAASAPGR